MRTIASVSSGKWYWETTVNSGTVGIVGIATSAMPISTGTPGFSADSYGYRQSNGNKAHSSSEAAYGAAWTAAESVVSTLLDLDNGTLSFWLNGADLGMAYTGLGSGPYFASSGDVSSSAGWNSTVNFGQSAFVYRRPWDYWGGLGAT